MFSTKPLLQVEEGQSFPVFKCHDLAIDNELVGKLSRLLGDFGN